MSMSIWSIRITELRMIIPLNAMMPRMATKPIGVPVGNKAATTPIKPERRDADHQKQLLKALQLDHQDDQHQV